jgi:hypothetical protein
MIDQGSLTPKPGLKGGFAFILVLILLPVEVLSSLAIVPLLGLAFILRPGPGEALGSGRAHDLYSALVWSVVALAVGVGSHVLRRRLSASSGQ